MGEGSTLPRREGAGQLREHLDGGTAAMVAGTLVSAGSAYVYQLVGARTLGPDAFAPVAVLWTLRFLLVTVLFLPIEQLLIRDVTRRGQVAATQRRISILAAAATVGLGTVAFATRGPLFQGSTRFALLTAALVPTFMVFAIARGRLAGSRRFTSYGLATGLEGLVQVAVALVVAARPEPDAAMYATAVVVSPLMLLPWIFAGRGESADVHGSTPTDAGRFLGGYVTGNAAAQGVLAGGPLAVAALGAPAASVSVATVTMTLLRAPLTLAYNVVARVLPGLIRRASSRGAGSLQRWARRGLVAGVAGAVIAGPTGWWIGPPIVDLLFGGPFRPPAAFTAMVAAGVVLAVASLAVQQGLVAIDRTDRLAAAWITALVTGIALLAVLDGGALDRVGTAFLAAETVALLLLVAAVPSR